MHPPGVTQQQAIDVDLGGDPAQGQEILRPIKLGLDAGIRLEAAAGLRPLAVGDERAPALIEGRTGALKARLPELV
jgi:hypothetical protein